MNQGIRTGRMPSLVGPLCSGLRPAGRPAGGAAGRYTRVRSPSATTTEARRTLPRALALVEVLVSMLVISGMLVSALYTVGAARMGESKTADNTVGMMLAESLMAEILQQPYEDPTVPGGLGLESGESGATRAAFDDVDDYAKWDGNPPQNRDGSLVSWAAGYRRKAEVKWLDPNNLTKTVKPATGLKQIRVKVTHDGQPQVVLFAVRSDARP